MNCFENMPCEQEKLLNYLIDQMTTTNALNDIEVYAKVFKKFIEIRREYFKLLKASKEGLKE